MCPKSKAVGSPCIIHRVRPHGTSRPTLFTSLILFSAQAGGIFHPESHSACSPLTPASLFCGRLQRSLHYLHSLPTAFRLKAGFLVEPSGSCHLPCRLAPCTPATHTHTYPHTHRVQPHTCNTHTKPHMQPHTHPYNHTHSHTHTATHTHTYPYNHIPI